MSGPVERIKVMCPNCGTRYDDWRRGSINLDAEGWDADDPAVQAYLRDCETATCTSCGHVVDLGLLVVNGNVWEFRG